MIVTGSPTQAFVDAIRSILVADTQAKQGSEALMALVTGVYGHLPEAARTAYPYVVLGQRSRDGDTGAMQTAGSNVRLQLDVWSDAKGPYTTHRILSRIAHLLERRSRLTVSGFMYLVGSLTCEFEDCSDEPDEDNPDVRLYHGIQRWTAEIHEN